MQFLKTNRIFTRLILVCSAFLLNASLAAQEPAVETLPGAAEKLIATLSSINSFDAKFSQTVENEYGQVLDETSGRFLVQRPNQFRWQTETQTIVADGRSLWTYDSDLEQLTIQTQQTTLANSPVTLLSGDAHRLGDEYLITLLGTHADTDLYELQPKAESAVFEKVQLLIRADKIIELLFRDALGQKTVIRFSAHQINQPIAPEQFSFSAPDGADIVDSRDKPVAADSSEKQPEASNE